MSGDDIISLVINPIDFDGLQVAYLGAALAHYLDLQSGDIIDMPLDAPAPDPARYPRIPTRDDASDAEDRKIFAGSLPEGSMRTSLEHALADAMKFRALLSGDRTIEKKWFSFKNDQATRAIEKWLREMGWI
jgi:hypothetical protein